MSRLCICSQIVKKKKRKRSECDFSPHCLGLYGNITIKTHKLFIMKKYMIKKYFCEKIYI